MLMKEKKRTIGFLVLWCGSVVADDEETGCDTEIQNMTLQPVRTLQEAKEFIGKYLSSYKDVKIVRVTEY